MHSSKPSGILANTHRHTQTSHFHRRNSVQDFEDVHRDVAEIGSVITNLRSDLLS